MEFILSVFNNLTKIVIVIYFMWIIIKINVNEYTLYKFLGDSARHFI